MTKILSRVVEVAEGKLQGITLTTRNGKLYYGYLGVPYAKEPLRFQPAEAEPDKWDGIRHATEFGMRSLQRSSVTKLIEGSEDCLFLNVFTPKTDDNTEKLPVMVFIHGGGYSLGGGDQYGGKYICDENVIFVTINYRLGALGFLSTGDDLVKGNMGLKDQVMALKWVQKNIGAFGGDKTSVTIFGESAGSGCVHYHILSSASSGSLFHSAILQSGTALSPWARVQSPGENAKRLGKVLGLSTNDMKELVDQLMKMDARAIAAQSTKFLEYVPVEPTIYFAPSVEGSWEGAIFTEPPYNIIASGNIPNPVPMILGCNTDEGLYGIMPILKSPEKVAALNQHWIACSPKVLSFNKELVPNAKDFANSAKDFYLGENKIFSEETLDGFKNMLSDRLINCSTQATARLHAKVQQEPNNIFAYQFAYKGEYSMLNIFKIQDVLGVSHGDELQYLMDQTVFKSKILPDSEADIVSRKLVQMWTNFAKEGRPSYKGELNAWKNVKTDEPIGWYRIGEGANDEMVTHPFSNRMEFWENLPWNQFLM